jgi:hypothetical protein
VALCRAAKEPTRELEIFTSENNKKNAGDSSHVEIPSTVLVTRALLSTGSNPVGRRRSLTRISGVAMHNVFNYETKYF